MRAYEKGGGGLFAKSNSEVRAYFSGGIAQGCRLNQGLMVMSKSWKEKFQNVSF